MVNHSAVAFIAIGLAISSSAGSQSTKPKTAATALTAVPVPRTEFIRTMDAEFRRMDADRNNVATRAEIEQFQRASAAAAADARLRELFARLDTDKNGQLSSAEFGKMAVSAPPPNAKPVLDRDDLNHDGSISLVEYRTAKLANFDRMDTDKDGIVTVVEMKAAGLVR